MTKPDDDVLSDIYAWVVMQHGLPEEDIPLMAKELGFSDDECRHALTALIDRHVLVPDPGGLVAASPEVAIAALVGPREGAHRQAEIDLLTERGRTTRLRSQLAALKPVYSGPQHHGASNSVDVLEDKFAVAHSSRI
ncbi:hypothetical protein GXW82_09825 [Streptacidiphilus sp. 4-A2]|nr:hypothetical protein [Streptacidiphilus sp. 4-A2]